MGYYLQPIDGMATGTADAHYTLRRPARAGFGGEEVITRSAVVVTADKADGDAVPLPGRTRREAVEYARAHAQELLSS